MFNDLRLGLRMVAKRPGLSAMAVIALGLGIGLTTTMFSIVHGAVLRGFPYQDSDELIALFSSQPEKNLPFMPVSIHDFADWRRQQTSFDDIAAFYAETVNVAGVEGRPVRYLGAYVSAHLFDVLGVRPILGRTFRPDEDLPSTPPVLLLSYRAWQDRFGGDPAIVGRAIRANSETTTVIGVMPEKFGFPQQMDAWLPLRIDPMTFERGSGPALEGTQLQAIGRLKDGVALDAAEAEMSAIAGRLATEYPATNEVVGVTVLPYLDTVIGPQGTSMLFTMLGAVFGVLLIACANVTNLLLARTVLRAKEVATRTAMGSSTFRTVSQLLAETLVLAVAGGALGLVIAELGTGFFNASLASQELPFWLSADLDPAVLGFVLALVLLSTLFAGSAGVRRAAPILGWPAVY